MGDIDNDGRMDVLIGVNGGAPVLLQNQAGAGNHWLGIKLQGVTCNRDAIGAQISWSAGGKNRSRFKNGGGSYLSSHDPRLVLGTRFRYKSRLAGNPLAGAVDGGAKIHKCFTRSLHNNHRRPEHLKHDEGKITCLTRFCEFFTPDGIA